MNACTQLCNQGRDCTCARPSDDAIKPVDGGNVRFAEPEIEPPTTAECVLVVILIIANFALLAAAGGFVYRLLGG